MASNALLLSLEIGEKLKKSLIEKGIKIPNGYVCQVWESSAEFILVDKDEKRIFGGDVTVGGYRNWKTKVREIKIGKGSMGPFDMACIASVNSYLLMAELINNFQIFEAEVEKSMEAYSPPF
jgi:hypothetical protein